MITGNYGERSLVVNALADHNVLSCPQVTRPHPGDNPLLLIFLVGGVAASELRLIKEAVSTHKPGSQVRRR